MKKILTLLVSLALMSQAAFAQCTINTGNTTDGFTPASLPCITQGVSYGQVSQVHVPATTNAPGFTVTVDSVKMLSVTGMPAGITYASNPTSGVIRGGNNGCAWISGTTNAAVGSYPLTCRVHVWIYSGFTGYYDFDTTMAGLGYPLNLDVCAGTPTACTINTSNTTNGFTPASLPCITQNHVYGQQDNVHIPATAQYQSLQLNIDSVKLLSVAGMPSGIAVTGNPASGVILGGGNGCLWYSGTTSAAVGTYPLTFNVRVWASYPGFGGGSFDTTLAGLGYNFSLDVCAPLTATVTPAGPDSICQGQTVTLQANTGTGYTYRWSNAAHTTTSSLTTGNAGSYRVTVYNGTDSVVSSYVVVVVGTPPTNTVILSNTGTLCPGDSVVLTADSGYHYTYHWSGNQTTRRITVRSSGTYSVTVANAFGCNIIGSRTVTFAALPTETITQNGNTLTGGTAYTSYQWYNSGGPISGATSISYTPTQSGTYTLHVTNASGCSGVSNSLTVTIGGPVTATVTPAGPDSICQGQTVTLQANLGTGYTYRWSDVSHTTTSSLTTGTAGSYRVTVYSGVDSAVSAYVVVSVGTAPGNGINISNSGTLCAGDSVILSAADSGYRYSFHWSGNQLTRSLTVRTSGTYNVTITNAWGCTASGSRTVNFAAAPTEVITQAGYTLTGQTAYTSYQWYFNGSPVSGATSQSYTAAQSGPYTLHVTNASGCTGISNTITVTIGSGGMTATITPAGHDTICSGHTTTLQANTATGYTYRWSDASHTTTSSFTTGTAGSYWVTVYNSAGDSAVSAPTVVVVSTLPGNLISINNSGSICAGDSSILTIADSAAGYTFIWNNSAVTRSITVRATGTYSMTVTNAYGCSATSSQAITVNSVPTVTITQNGLVLSSQTTAISYQWYRDNVLIPGATSQTYVVTQNGAYTIQVTGTGGCTGISNSISITGVGIADITAQPLAIYPNPGKGIFTITSLDGTEHNYQVSNTLGQIVATGVLHTDKQDIDLSSLPVGSYVFNVNNAVKCALRFTIVR
ncbi:MAG: repeat protein [Bacteroidetes bacterium]|nr:repeat protein [Bacteroidota bacterium]